MDQDETPDTGEDFGYNLPEWDQELRDAIAEHADRHIGGEPWEIGEIVSDQINLRLRIYPPAEDRPYYTIVTSGMSERPMNVPPGMDAFARAELVLVLPQEWILVGRNGSLDDPEAAKPKNYWPIGQLKRIARLPFDYDTWLAFGHTLEPDPEEPYEDPAFAGLVIGVDKFLTDEFVTLELPDGRTVFFWALYFLYPEELQLALKEGAEALEKKLDAQRIPPGLWPRRPNVAKRRGLFG